MLGKVPAKSTNESGQNRGDILIKQRWFDLRRRMKQEKAIDKSSCLRSITNQSGAGFTLFQGRSRIRHSEKEIPWIPESNND
jgi:hypothetical protein